MTLRGSFPAESPKGLKTELCFLAQPLLEKQKEIGLLPLNELQLTKLENENGIQEDLHAFQITDGLNGVAKERA
ncbi:hypothetical protein L345_15621, partial [Ophiophagus hannah]